MSRKGVPVAVCTAVVALALVADVLRAEAPTFCAGYPQSPGPGRWQSSRVSYSDGVLSYTFDEAGNRIPDFSYAGYKYGAAEPPPVPEVLRRAPAGALRRRKR